MKIVRIAPLVLALAFASAHAFETTARVIRVTPTREIVNEPYQSCGATGAQDCRQADHYDIRVMYNVVYEYLGQRFSAKLPYDPGPELKVNVSVTPK